MNESRTSSKTSKTKWPNYCVISRPTADDTMLLLRANKFSCDITTVCPEKKETKMFYVISSIKLRRFWLNLLSNFRNKYAVKSCKRFPAHLNNVSTLYLMKLKMLMRTCYHWAVTERNARIYSTLTVASNFARFESIWLLQHVGNTAREGVQNTRH